MERLTDRLQTVRQKLFVGREAERTLFQAALEAESSPFHVLHVFGPGGVGKTSLLHQFEALCRMAGCEAIRLDARDLEPAPEAFLHALHLAIGSPAQNTPQGTAAPGVSLPATAMGPLFPQDASCPILLIDTYELLTPLDDWLREQFLPQLPAQTLVVLAGRHPPSRAWRIHPGWQTLVRAIPLRNLTPAESRAYLTRRTVPPEEHRAVLNFTHGHPLALSLVADLFAQQEAASRETVSSSVRGRGKSGFRFQPEAAPDVVQVLLEHLVQQVPSAAHRAALEVCALVRLTTESLLSAMLDAPATGEVGSHELFEWLRGLSFIESGWGGLFPHDLAREALTADLQWRNPDRHGELHRRAHAYYGARLQQNDGEVPDQEQGRILLDYIFLHCNDPVVRPFLEWQDTGGLTTGAARESDWPQLLEMVERHEGKESAKLAAFWFARQPEGVLVVRDAGGEAAGFMARVGLHKAAPEDLESDPGTAGAWRWLHQNAPLHPGEEAPLFRFWMARDAYQDVSSEQSLIFINIVRHMLSTPKMAFTFLACADPDFWEPGLTYVETTRLPAADFEVDGRRFGLYQRDWRALPLPDWLETLAAREVTAAMPSTDGTLMDEAQSDEPQTDVTPTAVPQAASEAGTNAPLVVLSQPDFALAVQSALRDLTRPANLRGNALLHSRLVTERAGPEVGTGQRVEALRELLREACETLHESPRDDKFYQALYHAYLHPASTRERAADLLDVPFGTFRRHLKSGVMHVTEMLWQREVDV